MHSFARASVRVCVVRWKTLITMLAPAPQDGGTPLHIASQNGHLEVIEALLAKGADVEAKKNVSIARACVFCQSRLSTHMQNAHGNL